MLGERASLGYEEYVEGVAGGNKGAEAGQDKSSIRPVEQGCNDNQLSYEVREGGEG